jgi:hypothetical protein
MKGSNEKTRETTYVERNIRRRKDNRKRVKDNKIEMEGKKMK